jgi:hypothetical protein
MRFATMHMKTLPFTISTAVLFLMQPYHSSASEEEHEHEEHLGTSAIWGYSFLFNFLGCLPSAFAIVICLWAKLKIADKVITNLTSFASGVSFASTSLSVYSVALDHIFDDTHVKRLNHYRFYLALVSFTFFPISPKILMPS